MTLAESEKTPERSPESAQLDEAAIRRLQDDLPDDEVLYDLAELFRVFGDSTRIKILYALFESELCVNDIAQVVGISQSAVAARDLAVQVRQADLVIVDQVQRADVCQPCKV